MVLRMRMMVMLLVVLGLMSSFASTTWACGECGCEAKATSSDKFEKDRQAILAMAGNYRVTFQFHETIGLVPGYELHDPYTSEATEFVEVVEDEGEHIVMQHVLVVTNQKTGDKRVVKHWRQDWTYQDTDILSFRGNRTWEHVKYEPAQVAGTWSQAVYQVDDSPRYESFGAWSHIGDRSAWESGETWRPLPRREYTKRHDYQVMVARNRHTITPTGWVHEQDNYKLVLDDAGQEKQVLAHELGLNLYEKDDTLDLSLGRQYWDETRGYWQDVRDKWAAVITENQRVALHAKVDDKRLHQALFGLAEESRAAEKSDEARAMAKTTIDAFLVAEN